MSSAPPIVVLARIRNDAWILPRFLQVADTFAERVLLADEGSTDDSRDIAGRYERVTWIDAAGGPYDEGARWELLLRTARELVPGPRILLALEADEILAANAMGTRGWRALLAAGPGTVIFVERATLYFSTANCQRTPVDFPIGFVDDGTADVRGARLHSPRLPDPDAAPHLTLGDVKILHYALVRPEAQKAERRLCSMLENLYETKSLYQRRRAYWSRRVLRPKGPIEPTPREWFAGWEARGIEMTKVQDFRPYWQDVVALELLLEHGARRFWLDDIWEKDWNAFIVELGRIARIDPPPRALRALVNGAQRVVEWVR